MKKWLGSIMLLLAAVIWGFAFVAQSDGMNYVGALTFNGVRYLIGAAVLLPFAVYEGRKSAKETGEEEKRPTKKIFTKKILLAGLGCGLILFSASQLQQYGILFTDSVGKAGFITALYIVFVPVVNMFFGRKTKILVWISVFIAAIGLYLLCVKDNLTVNPADFLLIGCAVLFTGHIVFIDKFVGEGEGVRVSCLQFAIAGLIALPLCIIFEKPLPGDILKGWIPILYAGVLSCGVAYTFQILGQIQVEPTKASLILCLESVFATLGGWIILDELLTVKEIIGCIVVFAAIILAQFTGVSDGR